MYCDISQLKETKTRHATDFETVGDHHKNWSEIYIFLFGFFFSYSNSGPLPAIEMERNRDRKSNQRQIEEKN